MEMKNWTHFCAILRRGSRKSLPRKGRLPTRGSLGGPGGSRYFFRFLQYNLHNLIKSKLDANKSNRIHQICKGVKKGFIWMFTRTLTCYDSLTVPASSRHCFSDFG